MAFIVLEMTPAGHRDTAASSSGPQGPEHYGRVDPIEPWLPEFRGFDGLVIQAAVELQQQGR